MTSGHQIEPVSTGRNSGGRKGLIKKRAGDAGLHPQPGVEFLGMPSFTKAAHIALGDDQLRRNLGRATHTIRDKRKRTVGELDDWQLLRSAAAAIKDRTLAELDRHLEQFEAAATAAGATVHWAADAEEACKISLEIAQTHQATDVIKVKSMATQEIGLNEELAKHGIHAWETDLAELIVQLGGDTPSHFLVPAIHRNRQEIRQIFLDRMGEVGRPAPDDLTDDPRRLAEAARLHLREKFLSTKVAFSGANFAIAETGTLVVLESEGNGRMCTTLPRTLITVMGIEKVLPRLADLEVMLQLLPRSSTAERMNPYTSLWTGVTPGDGPEEFHLVLLDAGRTSALADEVGRQALHCIRCSACLNVCPVYERTGGHAYESVYPGPIGAILTPQLSSFEKGETLPWASSLCGACYDACPVKIDIPTVLVHLRGKVVRREAAGAGGEADDPGERLSMKLAAWAFGTPRRYRLAQRTALPALRLLAKVPGLARLIPGPLAAWTTVRELPEPPEETFSEWWQGRRP